MLGVLRFRVVYASWLKPGGAGDSEKSRFLRVFGRSLRF